MQHAERLTLAEMREFLAASNTLSFAGAGRRQMYGLVERTLRAQQYLRLSKKDKGVVRRYLAKISGRSLPQITRLIRQYRHSGAVRVSPPQRRRFPTRYTPSDIALLAAVDAAHEGLSGPAVRHILWRESNVYGKKEYQRLASISASHIYNLRRSAAYRQHHVHHTKTRARGVSIGERRKPDPRGQPGYLRVDTVHQGDTETRQGLYHINAVDTVTQWQVVGCCETISEAHLIPVLEAILHQFPFRVRGFHSDNGSEFLNHRVEKLLNKLLVGEFTKSRAHRTTDNALVEGKKRCGGAQAHRARTDCRRACDRVAAFLHGSFQSLLELPSSLRVCDAGGERQRQAAAALSARRLPHALRKAAFPRRVGGSLKGRHQRCSARAAGATNERHRMRPANAGHQKETAGRVPLPLVKPCRGERDLTVPISAGMGGGEGSSPPLCELGGTLLSFPLPLTPPPPSRGPTPNLLERRSPPTLCLHLSRPISGSFLDWKML